MPTTTLSATTTQTTEVKLKPVLKAKLLKRLRVYGELRQQVKALEAALDKEKGEIGKLREEAGVQSLSIDGYKVTEVTSVRTSLDKMKLLEMGVTTEMLQEATVSKPGKPYTKVTCPDDKSYDDDAA
jgi:hypothetical protein